MVLRRVRARKDVLRTDRARRTAQLARIGATTGSGYVSMKARGALASDERRDELRVEFELRTAEQVAATLGGMKGALMKLGQMASYLDQGLPEPVRDALAQLQTDAPPMSLRAGRAGGRARSSAASPERGVRRFDRVPIASASIGQVHRARTHDGVEVAVKVQYPGVDEAIAADLENTDLLFQLMGMLFPGLDPAPIVGELRDAAARGARLPHRGGQPALFVEAYRGPPVHPRARGGGRAVAPAGC